MYNHRIKDLSKINPPYPPFSKGGTLNDCKRGLAEIFSLTLFALLILLANHALALSTDREQPIEIAADQAQIDNMAGIAIYEGNVIVTQGSIRIDAETLTINYSKQHDIEKAVAVGKPAHFKQRLDSGEDIKAEAQEMEYNAIKSMLNLRIDAELRKGNKGIDNYISHAPFISYDTQRGIITANKGKQKSGRITMTFKPKPKE